MQRKQLSLVTYLLVVAFLLLIAASTTLSANQKIMSDGGREILLKTDGSWTFRSTDQFATTKDGRRIRLKEDGSWAYMGNALLKSEAQVRTTELDIKLQKVVIEKHKKKSQKNTQLKTQMVFYIQLNLSVQAEKNISIKNSDISLIEVKDNTEKGYPVLSITPAVTELKPGTSTTIIVRTEKSPTVWSEAKSMTVTFKAGIFNTKSAISLTQKIDDFEEKNVKSFK